MRFALCQRDILGYFGMKANGKRELRTLAEYIDFHGRGLLPVADHSKQEEYL